MENTVSFAFRVSRRSTIQRISFVSAKAWAVKIRPVDLEIGAYNSETVV